MKYQYFFFHITLHLTETFPLRFAIQKHIHGVLLYRNIANRVLILTFKLQNKEYSK